MKRKRTHEGHAEDPFRALGELFLSGDLNQAAGPARRLRFLPLRQRRVGVSRLMELKLRGGGGY